MSKAARVVVTGLGLVTPLGVGKDAVWKRLLAGQSGLTSTNDLNDERFREIPSKVVGVVPHGSKEDHKLSPESFFDAADLRRIGIYSQYALIAAHEALTDANWFPQDEESRIETGVCVGSSIGGVADSYENSVSFSQGGYRKVQPLFVPKLLPNMAAGLISIWYGLKGVNHSASTACATGSHSVGDAYRFIKDGYSKVVVAGATEAAVHPVALSGFARAKSVVTKFNDDPSKASRPFDKDRDGFVLGEGSGIVVLEELEHARARNAKIYAEVVGYGLSGDGHHITAPSPDGSGARRSMDLALRGLNKNEIDYVNAHATSTKIGDAIEANAILNTFKDNKGLHVSSTKGAIGHLLGAAGAVEAVFTVLAVKDNKIPPTLNLDEPDVSGINHVPNHSIDKEVRYAVSNSFGFGGTNSSLVFKKYTDN